MLADLRKSSHGIWIATLAPGWLLRKGFSLKRFLLIYPKLGNCAALAGLVQDWNDKHPEQSVAVNVTWLKVPEHFDLSQIWNPERLMQPLHIFCLGLDSWKTFQFSLSNVIVIVFSDLSQGVGHRGFAMLSQDRIISVPWCQNLERDVF